MEALLPAPHGEATAIHAVPAELGGRGFRLLLLREFHMDGPPGFALIDQHLLRPPQRLNRHGMSFALTFRPEVMAGVSELIGRPSARDEEGRVVRNPRWPGFGWSARPRAWADGTATVDWWAEVNFPHLEDWGHFRAHFAPRLAGRLEVPVTEQPVPRGDRPGDLPGDLP